MSDNLPAKTSAELMGKNEPGSFYHMVPESIQRALEDLDPRFLEMPENELDSILPDKRKVDIYRLRESFWLEHGIATQIHQRMHLKRVYETVCTRPVYNTIIKNQAALALILTPPAEFNVSMKEALSYAITQMRDILAQPHVDDDGKPNPKVMDIKRRVFENLANRVKGMPVQRTETKNLNMNYETTDKQEMRDVLSAAPQSVEEVDAQLRQLEDIEKE